MDKTGEAHGLHIHLTGVVQGVGFRPFVYGLAQRYGLVGWVRNSSSGVDIEIDGPAGELDAFAGALITELPPLAHIDRLETAECRPNGFTRFDILDSKSEPGAFQPISPDMAICPDCLRELFDPADRRCYAFFHPATGDERNRQPPHAGARADERREHGEPHADDAVPHRAFRAFLPAQTTERQDEKNSRNYVSCRRETEIHIHGLLTISGTWRACAG